MVCRAEPSGWRALAALPRVVGLPSWPCLPQDVLAAELRQQLALAQAATAASEQRAAAAEERSQQLEVALNESHATLQQRNAEYALVTKVGRARCLPAAGSKAQRSGRQAGTSVFEPSC